jgi:hypothetical protein
MSQVRNMDMLGKGTLVNVLWQWYLPGGSLEKNPLLNEVYFNCMGEKSTRNGIYMCGQKDKICVGIH